MTSEIEYTVTDNLLKRISKKLISKFEKYLKLNDSIVLDVGSGVGTISIALAPYVKKIYGIDPSSKMIEISKSNSTGIDNIVFDIGKIEEMKFKTNIFNIIIFNNSLQFVKEPIKVLNRLFLSLVENGIIYIKLPFEKFVNNELNKDHPSFDSKKYNKVITYNNNLIELLKKTFKFNEINHFELVLIK